jgi:beta-mannosidase
LVYLNQLTQAEGIGLGIMAHRAAKPYCMGTLYWQLNDCWPGISWSSRDFFGHWKALQHKTRELYQPLTAHANVNESDCQIIMLNDRLDSLTVNLTVAIKDFNSNVKFNVDTQIQLKPNQNIEAIRFDLKNSIDEFDPNRCYLHMQWNCEGQMHERFQLFCKPSKLKLNSPKLEIVNLQKSTDGWKFDIISDTFVKWLYIPEAMGDHIEPNFMNLQAGKPNSIICKTDNINFELDPSTFLHLQKCLKP